MLFLRKKGKSENSSSSAADAAAAACVYVLGLDVMVRHVKQLVNLSYNGVGKRNERER